MWLKCENVKCERGDVHMLVKRRINCELQLWHFLFLSITENFTCVEANFVWFSCSFIQFPHVDRLIYTWTPITLWICVILMRKCTFHISKTTNHMTIFNSCLKVRSWRIKTDEIRSNWVKTKTLSWKLPGLVGLQGCRERMISNLTTTEPRYMTVIISSTVNTTLSTAALTTLTHTYL